MATAVIMPRDGQSVESCIITEWKVKKGDAVKVGDILFSYETDKSSFDKKADAAGILLEVFAGEGDDVPCLETVCIIGEAGEDISSLLPGNAAPAAAAPAETEAKPEAKEAPKAEAPSTAKEAAPLEGERLRISPRAKNLALRTGADLSKAEPTGPMGRLIERDINAALDKGFTAPKEAVEKYLAGDKNALAAKVVEAPAATPAPAAPAEAPAYTDTKISGIRKTIAKSMHTSLSTMAQLTMNASFDASELLAFRAKVKENGEKLGMANITLNDMVLFGVAKTLMQHKELNAHWLDDVIRTFANVNLGIAVDTDRGLMVPTLNKAETLTLNELSKQAKVLIKDTQGGSIAPDKLKGASFTVTNLGSLGIESFTPVINPPQVAILGVCTVTKRPKETANGIALYPAMGLSLTIDHRAIDGAPAARFLKDLCENLEHFSMLLAK